MRLLLMANPFSVHTRRWAMALARRGHAVLVLARGRLASIPGVRVLPFRVPGWSLRYPQRWWGRYHAFVRSVVRRFPSDVVHLHFLKPYHVNKKDLCGRPFVVSVWGSDVIREGRPAEDDEAKGRKLDLLAAADQVTALSHYLARECAGYGGPPVDEIEVIPFGIDTRAFVEAAQEGRRATSETLRIGFVKALRPSYGADVLLRSFADVLGRISNVELVMVGGGEQREALEGLARELGVAPRVRWEGFVPYERIPRVHASLDVFVMPTVISESFGVSAVEAQAAGVPVVASDWPGIREAVAAEGGILVPPGDPVALAEALCNLLADAELRRRMGLAGQRYVRDRYEFSDNVDAMERVYHRLAHADRGPDA